MSSVERLTITMPAETAAMLRRTVEGGEYASTSEIVREALRDWSRRREEESRDLQTLREAIRIGDESGPSIPAGEFFAELRQMIAERRATKG
ncbi:ribbon-helix-helix domain-containing protein [Aurantimonas marianensis]|uniref:Type II toxin-antitoxin system ParD family antitoxin n=1 Tax=Aurantimonas marianensis TaxID=2920428 RepID=A0A9X2HBM7_9HYPH|nr:type II toxin-antitoxin system ParD family antitoxin [Aurantimonas marianensis]MCP3055457.1 type II toxin-antitoxin system ParD family antitoxin [Aurantimonas marianensis]